MNVWAAMVVGAVAFGIAHAYQGPIGILKTGVVGLIMGTLYLLSGSIWGPMLVHAVVDITSGRIAHCALHRKAVAEFEAVKIEREQQQREAMSGGEAGGRSDLT